MKPDLQQRKSSAKMPLVLILGWAALFLAMLLPPEAYPNGKLAVALCATFAFLASLSERRLAKQYVKAGAWAFTLLLAHTLIFSLDLYRSLDMLSMLWTYYC